MLGTELRRRYLEFFESKGAKRIASDSLIPNDPTLMFTSAGMVQFKPYFLGLQTPSVTRATTAQKCLRTTDIESVGDTSHCTFFEMLGNFSFGDYFKSDVIPWAWEFLFDVLQLDLSRVRVTIFETDDEAFHLWRTAGMPENKIFRFGEAENYWFVGPTGPCGPDSEIFYDTQPHLPPTPDGVWDDGRWLEIWNLVFMQFDRSEDGTLTPLPKKSIDTGMGLERTAAVLANLRGPFETDLFAPIIQKLEQLSGVKYGSSDQGAADIAFRRIADHARAAVFCLTDGVIPSNIGRGYVLRRIIRRAVLAGSSTLGLQNPFLTDLLPVVIEHRRDDYPDLETQRETILRYAGLEERQFRRTLEAGSARLSVHLESEKVTDTKQISGEDAFTLFATYGFPVELTIEIAGERGVALDRVAFDALLVEHSQRSEGNKQKFAADETLVPEIRQRGIQTTTFVGYSERRSAAITLAIVKDGRLVDSAGEGDIVQIVLDFSPFYAESGGQVADTGRLESPAVGIEVTDCQKDSGYWFHTGTVVAGEIVVGEPVTAQIDGGRRSNIERNHTVTHLLHKALQTVLGPHAQQRGSLVSADRLRFDFTHEGGLTASEMREIEVIVNEKILDDLEVRTEEKPIEEARNLGAMMLFGEKYGDVVRIVTAEDYSVEFCGGTHLKHTSQAGLFKLLSESSSQAGVRRIEAVTGRAALARTLDHERLLQETAAVLKTTASNVLHAAEKLQSQLKEKDNQLASAQKHGSESLAERLVDSATQGNAFTTVVHCIEGQSNAETLRTLADEIMNRLGSGLVILGAEDDGRVVLAVKVSKDQVANGLHAGNIIREAAKVADGGGGGRPDFAQAGGKDVTKIREALEKAHQMALSMV